MLLDTDIIESMEDEADFKIEEDDIKIEEDNLHLEVVEDVSREDSETEKMCDLCPAVFESMKSLQRHVKVKHDTRECICPECGISVVGMQKLAHHRSLHQTFRCPSCDKELGINQRSRHLKICVKPEISCDQCDYVTKNEHLLQRHKKSHQKFYCDQCPYQAKSRSKLDHHQEKKHGPEAEPHRQCVTIHHCGYCDYNSKNTGHVRDHERVCKVRKRHETRVEDIDVVKNDDLGNLFAETRTSEKDFKKIVRFFYKKCPEMFESHSYDAVKNYCASLGWLHESKVLEFRDSNGKTFFAGMGMVADVPRFIREICIGKGIDFNRVKCVISCDSGQGTKLTNYK